MTELGRHAFLAGAVAASGGVLAGGSLATLVAEAAGGITRGSQLFPVADKRDGKVRLHIPRGFEYRSFHDTDPPGGVVLNDGTVLPGRHDGMAAFAAPNGRVWLVRNHEVNGPGAAFGPGAPYDAQARGGTTTILVTNRGVVENAFTSLNGTQMNCSGGKMPWGSWITCEETVNGPDVGPDFTTTPNIALTRTHGWIFEVKAGLQSNREPITAAGRFAHEAAAFDPVGGKLYLTEDNFGFPSGLYRYTPPINPMTSGSLANGGTLEMLRVVGQSNAHLEANQTRGTTYTVDWVPIGDPDPQFPYTPGQTAPTTNNTALTYVSSQGWSQGAAWFSRLEGATYADGQIWFTSTQGGGAAEVFTGVSLEPAGYGNGFGQVWSYNPATGVLTCQFQSSGQAQLDLPDNVTTRTDRGPLIMCEDTATIEANGGDNYVRALTRGGQIMDLVLNRNRNNATNATRFADEFAGATFSPDGGALFVNTQAGNALTYAIWGPWGRIGV